MSEQILTPVTLDQFLNRLPRRPALLGLGEPTHGVEELLRLRNDVFRHLVEEHGYQAIALEASCLSAVAIDDFVRGTGTSIDDVLADGFTHGFGAFDGNRTLLEWLREYNQSAVTPVRVYGFDAPIEATHAQSPRIALMPLHEYLREHRVISATDRSRDTLESLLADDTAWTSPAPRGQPTTSMGRGPDAHQLWAVANDLATTLQQHTPQLVARSGIADFRRAKLLARTALGLVRYHAVLASGDPNRAALGMGIRAAMMADNLLAIAQETEQAGPVLVHAHNGHLQRHPAHVELGGTAMRWRSAGSIVASTIGMRYAYIAGDYTQPGADAGDSFQAVMAQATEGRALFRSRDFSGTARNLMPVPGHGIYTPIDPHHLDAIDGVAFVASLDV